MVRPETFSVLINDAVRIDDLIVADAIEHSETFCALFSLHDSEEMRAVEQNRPIPIHLICYEKDGATATEDLSKDMLRWLFGVLRPPVGYAIPADLPGRLLRDCCHALQIMAFLGITRRADHLVKIAFNEHPLHESVEGIRPFYGTLPRDLQEIVRVEFCRALKSQWFRRDDQWVLCSTLADLILRGADLNDALRASREAILTLGDDGALFCWGNRDIMLTRRMLTDHDMISMFHTRNRTYVGFIFSLAGEPIGWLMFSHYYIRGIQSVAVRHLRDENGSWESKREPPHIFRSNKGSAWTISERPYAVMLSDPSNPYQDIPFVQKVCAALGITLAEIETKARK